MNTKVAVGPTTVLGAGVSTSAFVAAVLALIAGDHSQQVLGTIAGGTVGLVSLAIVLIGRYSQAKALAKNAPGPQLQVPTILTTTAGTTTPAVAFTNWSAPPSPVAEEPGDILPGLPHLPTANPARVPADAGDAGTAEVIA